MGRLAVPDWRRSELSRLRYRSLLPLDVKAAAFDAAGRCDCRIARRRAGVRRTATAVGASVRCRPSNATRSGGTCCWPSAVFGFFRARTAYKAQRMVLGELAERECAVFSEYPGPDAIWTAVQWLASPRYSAAEVAQFLDASIGTAVYMQCQTRPIPTLPRLPGLLAIDVMMDAEGTANGSDAEESQRGRLTAGNLPRLARVSLGGVGNDSGELWDVFELPRLRFLKISLSRLGVDDSGEHFLQRLHLLTQLEALEIESCEVGSRLVSLKELRRSPGALAVGYHL